MFPSRERAKRSAEGRGPRWWLNKDYHDCARIYQLWIKDNCGDEGLEFLWLCELDLIDFGEFWCYRGSSDGKPKYSREDILAAIREFLQEAYGETLASGNAQNTPSVAASP